MVARGLRGLRTAGIYELARDLRLDADDLLPLAEAANLLSFAGIEAGDVTLTATGRRFGDADILSKKEILRQQATGGIRRLREIVRRLQTALERAFSAPEAGRQLDTATDWGRFAELFAYDDGAGVFYTEEEIPAAAE